MTTQQGDSPAKAPSSWQLGPIVCTKAQALQAQAVRAQEAYQAYLAGACDALDTGTPLDTLNIDLQTGVVTVRPEAETS